MDLISWGLVLIFLGVGTGGYFMFSQAPGVQQCKKTIAMKAEKTSKS